MKEKSTTTKELKPIIAPSTRSNSPFGCFRSCTSHSEPKRIRDIIVKEEIVNDMKLRSYHSVFLTPEEYLQKHPYDTERFSLEDLQNAGVKLKEIPCGNLLNGRDETEIDITPEEALAMVENEINNQNNKD